MKPRQLQLLTAKVDPQTGMIDVLATIDGQEERFVVSRGVAASVIESFARALVKVPTN